MEQPAETEEQNDDRRDGQEGGGSEEPEEHPDAQQRRQFAWNNGDFGYYMSEKRRKLDDQFASRRAYYDTANATLGSNPSVFRKVSLFVDGKTNPTREKLQDIVLAAGGSFKNYYVKGQVTHVVVERLPLALIERYRVYQRAGAAVVKPAWVLESAAKGILQDARRFALEELTTQVQGQKVLRVNEMTKASPPKRAVDKDEKKGHGPLASNENPNFVKDYFAMSRLSFIGTFKSRYETLLFEEAWQSAACASMDELLTSASQLVARPPNPPETERLIVHIDIDCCFAAAAIAKDHSLKEKPIVVCHANATSKRASESRSEISSANYLARVTGIKAGMFLGDAVKLCPNLVTVGYDFAAYQAIARCMVRLFFEMTPVVQMVSVDEAYLDLTHCEVTDQITNYVASIPDDLAPIASRDTVLDNASPDFQERAHILARYLRAKLVNMTGCSASAGIGVNMLCARMATKRAKPDGQFALPTKESLAIVLDGQPVSEVSGVGWSTRDKLKSLFRVSTCDELRKVSLESLRKGLGDKIGQTLYQNLRGEDSRHIEVWAPRKSVSAECRWGVRFGKGNVQNEKRIAFVKDLVEVVVERLGKATASKMTYTLLRTKPGTEPWKLLGHGPCTEHTRSATIAPTQSAGKIAQLALRMHEELPVSNEDLRGVGIQLSNLKFPWRTSNVRPDSLHRFFEEEEEPEGNRPQADQAYLVEGDSNKKKVEASRLEKLRLATTEEEAAPRSNLPVDALLAKSNGGYDGSSDEIRPIEEAEIVEVEIEPVALTQANNAGTRLEETEGLLRAEEVALPPDVESLDPSVVEALPKELRIGIQERISAARRSLSVARSAATESLSRTAVESSRTRPPRSGNGRTSSVAGRNSSRARSRTDSRPAQQESLCIQLTKHRTNVVKEQRGLRQWMVDEPHPEAASVSEKLWRWVYAALESEQFVVATDRVKLVCLTASQLGGGWPDVAERLSTVFETETAELLGIPIDPSQ